MQSFGRKPLSPLQFRIRNHGDILTQYNDTFENNIQPLLQFVIILCENQNYGAADDILRYLIESDSFQGYDKLSSIWILRSEIAEELKQLPKALKLLEKAARRQAEPAIDIMNAFQSFRDRYSQKSKHPTAVCMDTPVPLSNISKKRKIEPRLLQKNSFRKITQKRQPLVCIHPSPFGSVAESPIIADRKAPCTPLTDDFELFLFESDRKAKQRKKKFYFRSKQNKKQVNTLAKLPQTNVLTRHKATLSPILDVSEVDMSLSSSFSVLNVSQNPNNNEDIDSSNMDMSVISDVSSIAAPDKCNDGMDSRGNSPELPPSASYITIPITPMNIGRQMSGNYPDYRHMDKENQSSFINQQCAKGSEVRMEIINLSPAKKNKFGSDKILSPVRRSKRIQQMNEERSRVLSTPSLQQLLQDSNYTYVPNPMLNSSDCQK